MKIRFQADADLDEDIVTGLRRREPGIDFQTATEAGLRGLDDHQVLARAAEDGRLLATHDLKTMPYHFADFILHKKSPGLVIISQKIGTSVAIEELLSVGSLHQHDFESVGRTFDSYPPSSKTTAGRQGAPL